MMSFNYEYNWQPILQDHIFYPQTKEIVFKFRKEKAQYLHYASLYNPIFPSPSGSAQLSRTAGKIVCLVA